MRRVAGRSFLPSRESEAIAANPNTGAFFTRLADAKAAAASNTKAGVPVNVKFRAGKGYYLYQGGGASKGASTPSGGGTQSFIQNYLAGLTKGPSVPAPPDFSSPAFSSAVDAGVNAQVQPQVDAIKQQQGHEKFLYDQETQNAKGYSEGLAKILTGGNTNDAGMQYSKDTYGGSYLGAIASQQGGQLLAKITQNFNNNDWQLASKLADAMAQVPAIREKVTSDLESQANDTYGQQYKSAQDDFSNRIKIAGLIINQSNTAFNQQRLTNNDAFSQKARIAALQQSQTRIGQTQQRLTLQQQSQANLQAYRQTTNEFKREGIALKETAQAKAVQAAITTGKLPNAAWSKLYGHIVDNNGNAITGADGKPIPIAASAKAKGAKGAKAASAPSLTPLQINELRGDAATIADGAFNGLPKAGNLPAVPPANFGQALSEMRKGAGHGSVPLPFALKALQQAGFKIPRKYDRYLGSSGGQGDPFDASPGIVGPGLGASADKVVQVAHSFLGVPYVWGGNDPSKALDCSSFIQQTFKRLGVDLPRTTYDQVKVGTPVGLNQLQPGDAVFTRPGKNGPNHVGLYIGNGMVQESPHTGDVNKIISLTDFLTGGFVAARRYLNGNG